MPTPPDPSALSPLVPPPESAAAAGHAAPGDQPACGSPQVLEDCLAPAQVQALLEGVNAVTGTETRLLALDGTSLAAVLAPAWASLPAGCKPADSDWRAGAAAAAAANRSLDWWPATPESPSPPVSLRFCPIKADLSTLDALGSLVWPVALFHPLQAVPRRSPAAHPVPVGFLATVCRAGSGSDDTDTAAGAPAGLVARQMEALATLLGRLCAAKGLEGAIRDAAFVLDQAQRVGQLGHYDCNILADHWTSSPVMDDIFGIPPDYERSIAGWLALIHPEDRPHMQAYVTDHVIGARHPFDQVYRIIRPSDGAVRWLHGRGKVFVDDRDRAARLLGTIQDITERKLTEDRTRRILDALTRSNAELERFAYVASHDLQEPIRTMVAYSQLVQRRYHDRLDADADAFLAFIAQGAKRMQALVLDILEYARIPARSEEFTAVDLGRVIDSVTMTLRGELAEADASLTVTALPLVRGDQVQLVTLFLHLVGNALKFRTPDHKPTIQISAVPAGTGHVVTVRDNGIGIDPAYQAQVFEVFKRLHTIQAYPGTGIGLAIAKRIVERHEGRIWVESTPGEGATFFVRLPAA